MPELSVPRRLLFLLPGVLAIAALLLIRQTPVGAAPASADLDQCRNGDQLAPVQCIGAAWVNGNAGASNAHWFEGGSIAYRMRFSGLSTGASNLHALTIEWDTTQGGKHALDYLTSFNRTETTADPCSGVTGCSLGSFTQFAIPQDINTGLGTNTAAGRWNQFFNMFNGATIQSVSAYSIASGSYLPAGTGASAGNSSTRITITFTTTTANPVLAWGAHIATRADWGITESAIAISGSPYHMRLIALDGSGGNQDRSLSSAAAIFPASLTIIKDVQTTGGTDSTSGTPFTFTGAGPTLPGGGIEIQPSPFNLTDDGTDPDPVTAGDQSPNTAVFSLTLFGNGNTKTVTETTNSSFNQLVQCSESSGGLGSTANSTPTTLTAGNIATINAEEGEIITCTFVNRLKSATLTVIKTVITDNGGAAGPGFFTIHVKNDGTGLDVTGSPAAGVAGPTGRTYTLDAGDYTVSEDTSSGYSFDGFSGTGCAAITGKVHLDAGDAKTCTLTNNDVPAHLIIIKSINNDAGGNKSEGDFSFTIGGVTASGGQTVTGTASPGADKTLLTVGSYTVTEGAHAGYSVNYSTDCNGTIALGQTKTCTVTNTALAATNSATTAQKVILLDTMTITGIRPGASDASNAGKNDVIFQLFDNATCSGQAVYTKTLDVSMAVDPNNSNLRIGTASTPNDGTAYSTTAGGTFRWKAQYIGDLFNAGVAADCAAVEQTVVTFSYQ